MRILYLYQYFTTPEGSWSTRAYEMSKRWVEAGHEVTVVTSLYDKSDLRGDGLLSFQRLEGIQVKVINVGLSNKHGFFRRVLSFLSYAVLASCYALTEPADRIVASSGPITVALPALLARYLRRIPLVFEIRDLWPEGAIQLGVLTNPWLIRMARWLERRMYRASDPVVALSDGMASGIREVDPHCRLVVVPNASDNHLFGPESLSPLPDWATRNPYVVYTGSLGKMDDGNQLVELALSLKSAGRADISIVILGDGMERRQLEERVRQLSLHQVRFLGLLPKHALVAWLQQAKCALMVFKDVPCLATVSPNKMFDAFAAGTPVVQTTQGWIRELIAREECGVNVGANRPEEMARAVCGLVDNPELRERLSANCRRVAQQLFARDRLAEEMLMAIQSAELRS